MGARNVLLVHAHPNPVSFNTALRDQAHASLVASGHTVRSIDLYREGFDPALSADDLRLHIAPLESKPAIHAHAEQLRWADTVVLVYPTWWSGPPAMLKGWFDRVWANEVAFELPADSNRIKGTLSNITRLVVVTTHGSDRMRNLAQGPGGRRMILRGLRVLCSWRCRTSWIAMYGMDRADDRDRREFMERVSGFMTDL